MVRRAAGNHEGDRARKGIEGLETGKEDQIDRVDEPGLGGFESRLVRLRAGRLSTRIRPDGAIGSNRRKKQPQILHSVQDDTALVRGKCHLRLVEGLWVTLPFVESSLPNVAGPHPESRSPHTTVILSRSEGSAVVLRSFRIGGDTTRTATKRLLLELLREKPFVNELQPVAINHDVVVVAAVMLIRATVDFE